MNLSIPKLVPSLAGTIQNRLARRTQAEGWQPETIVPDNRSVLHRTVEKFVAAITNEPLTLSTIGISFPHHERGLASLPDQIVHHHYSGLA